MSEFFLPGQPRPREDPYASGVVQNNLEFFMLFFEKGLNDGDTLVWDQVLGRYLAKPSGGVEVVTALPIADLYPGREVVLTNSLTAPTWAWHFWYNADSISSYKWEFIGGSPAYEQVPNFGETASTIYTNLATLGPDVQLPVGVGGDFNIRVGADIWHDLVDSYAYMAYSIGAAEGENEDAAINSWRNPTSCMKERRKVNVPSGALIRARYKSSVGSNAGRFQSRWLSVLPYRVG